MIIEFEKSAKAEDFANHLQVFEENSEVQSIFILSCDGNDYTPENINKILQNCKKPIFGGIFPQIIYEDMQYEKGTVFCGLSEKTDVHIIPNLSLPDENYDRYLEKTIDGNVQAKTIFVFVDGFAKRIASFIESLFNIFGLETNYIGGGAGSLSMKQKPCLFSNEGLIKDSAIIVHSSITSGIGVSHGWEKISGPLKVTESDRNKVISLDWEPAFNVYKNIVESHSGDKFTNLNFFEISKGYPLGITTLSDEEIIRDPVSADKNGSITCIGEVPQDSFVSIMNGKKISIIRAAGNALFKAENELPEGKNIETVFFIDCISRVLFLEGDFSKELAMVQYPGKKVFGALTIGEIANNKKDYLEFYNKTSVIGVFAE